MENKTFSWKENTWNWKFEEVGVENAEYLLVIQVLPQDNGSRLPVVQENLTDEEAVQPIKEGWEKGNARSKDYLWEQQGGTVSVIQSEP